MEKNKVKKIAIVALIILMGLAGISYAFFAYNRIGVKNQQLIAGQIYLKLLDKTDSISLNNIFPQKVEEARARTDNVLRFSISGVNTTKNKNIYYEIKLNEGTDISGKNRFNPEDLRFDLVEIKEGIKKTVVDNMSFSDLEDRRIWVNTIDSGTTPEINIEYELRMWLSEDVLISDTELNATYSASEYKNHFANAVISVYGDLSEKSAPVNYFVGEPDSENLSFWPEVINAERENISEVHFISLSRTAMKERYSNATIKADVTDTTKNKEGSVLTWLETDSSDNSKYIMYVASEGITFLPEDSTCMFAMFTSLVDIEFSNINTKNVTNMMGMFAMDSILETVNLSSFDTSNVTMMTAMFAYSSNLTELDLSNFDMSKVEIISGMFGLCSNLTTLNISNWDLSNVSEYDELFMECSNLNNINMSNWKNVAFLQFNPLETMSDLSNLNLNLSNWDVKYGLMLTGFFAERTNIVSLDLSNWNTKYIIDMSSMFYGCTNLVSLDLTGWNTENVTNMSQMFKNCEKLEQLDLSSFNTKNVTDMSGMFTGCSSLTELDLSFFDTRKVTSMKEMFTLCSNLQKLNLSSFDTKYVNRMDGLFAYNTNLLELDISNFTFNNILKGSVEYYDYIFYPFSSSCKITVKSEKEKTWILQVNNRSFATENVIVKEQ